MSTFILYKSKGKSLKNLGKINKAIYIGLILSMPLLHSGSKYLEQVTSIDSLYFTLSLIFIIICLLILSGKLNKNLEKLGELKITNSGITKTILDLTQHYQFQGVNEVNIKKHIRSFFMFSNQDGTEAYLVKLKYRKAKKETFVVSSQSIDKPDVNFLETLRNIEKFTGHKIKIN